MNGAGGIEHLLRDLAPQVLGVVMRRCRELGAAEDAVQEALVAASTQWPSQGVPEDPRAWLVHVAARRVTDHIRAESARRRRESLVVSLIPLDEQLALAADDDAAPEGDDTLLLLFLCCHPALSPTSAIALTLRAVGGLTTVEIASAFLVPEATMAQRISRAKRTIKGAGGAFELPEPAERATRLGQVMHVLYLVFSEGYTASSGADLQRTDLSGEALRLARKLHALLPEEPEVAGLLSLMLLTDARRAARCGPGGELIALDDQDRTLWDRASIGEGVALLEATLPRGAVGPYQLQAAVAALHDEAETAARTDWPQILALYTLLDAMSDNPMVRLNVAIATAMVNGPAAGLAILDDLQKDPRIEGHHRLDAVRAHLLERAGDHASAIAAYLKAAARTASVPERDYLLLHAGELRARSAPPGGR